MKRSSEVEWTFNFLSSLFFFVGRCIRIDMMTSHNPKKSCGVFFFWFVDKSVGRLGKRWVIVAELSIQLAATKNVLFHFSHPNIREFPKEIKSIFLSSVSSTFFIDFLCSMSQNRCNVFWKFQMEDMFIMSSLVQFLL